MPIGTTKIGLVHKVEILPVKPGEVYGTLTVVEAASDYIYKDGRHEKRWVCKYECGHTIMVYQSKLREGYNHKCSICRMQDNIDSMIGKKFNRLIVIDQGEDYVLGKKRETRYNCICDCGNIVLVKGTYLRNGHTKSCGCLQLELAAIANNKRHVEALNNKVLTLPPTIVPLANSVPGVIFLTDEEINNMK